jgi:hypothetical protein
MLPGELAKHAISEGTKAVTKFTHWDWLEKADISVNKIFVYNFWFLWFAYKIYLNITLFVFFNIFLNFLESI